MQVQEDVEQQYARVATKRCECCVPVALVRGLNQWAWLARDANGHTRRRHDSLQRSNEEHWDDERVQAARDRTVPSGHSSLEIGALPSSVLRLSWLISVPGCRAFRRHLRGTPPGRKTAERTVPVLIKREEFGKRHIGRLQCRHLAATGLSRRSFVYYSCNCSAMESSVAGDCGGEGRARHSASSTATATQPACWRGSPRPHETSTNVPHIDRKISTRPFSSCRPSWPNVSLRT